MFELWLRKKLSNTDFLTLNNNVRGTKRKDTIRSKEGTLFLVNDEIWWEFWVSEFECVVYAMGYPIHIIQIPDSISNSFFLVFPPIGVSMHAFLLFVYWLVYLSPWSYNGCVKLLHFFLLLTSQAKGMVFTSDNWLDLFCCGLSMIIWSMLMVWVGIHHNFSEGPAQPEWN